MKFMHWKAAQKRAEEIKPELDSLNEAIKKNEAEARSEALEVEKREALITTIQGDVVKRDGLQTEYDEAVQERDKLKGQEERQIGLLSGISTGRVQERHERDKGENVYETRGYELAWAEYVKTGNDTEVRQLISTQDAGSAGIMVPHTLINKIEDTMRKGGRILSLCSITSIKGITEHPIATSRTEPAWHEETGTDKKVKKGIGITSVPIEAQFLAEILEVTKKFEADSTSGFWDWIFTELPDALKRVADGAALFGPQNGANGIRGILTNTNALFVATLAAHVLNFNSANEAVAELDDSATGNVTAVMNQKTFLKNVMGLVGTDGHPIWQVMTSNLGKPAYFFGGYPVEFTNHMPTYDEATTGQPYMLFGDFEAMKLNFPLGMAPQITRDPYTRKDENIIEYLSEIYVGGNIVRPGSFVKVTKA